MLASRRIASISLFAMMAFAGCTREAPPTVTLAASAPPAISSAPTATARPAASASAAPLPEPIKQCEEATGHHGSWQPTVDEVVLAASAMKRSCIEPASLPAAIRACAARIGKATVTVSPNSIDDANSCQESFVPAEHGGRRWIVRETMYRNGATFSGSGNAVELRGGKAVRYVENEGLVEDCTPKGKRPKGAPADWPSLPADLMHFLCGFSR